MINMEYSIWQETCKGFFSLNKNIINKHLQLFPFTLISEEDKGKIQSEYFFNTYIKSGALFAISDMFDSPDRYLQKSDSTFRYTKLVSPILYLYLLSIGTQLSKKYTISRKSTRVYHAGNVSEFSYHYKESYDNYSTDVNYTKDIFNYFIKIDLTNFYDSINLNELFRKINRDGEILNPRTAIIYKNILNMIGDNKFPTIENNAGLYYIATEIYLDDSDTIIETYLDSFKLISGFQLIRYVDDLFIFINCEEEDRNTVVTEIKNKLTSIYSREKLSLNENKFKCGISEDVSDALKSTDYDFYVNDKPINFSDYYTSDDLVKFFDGLIDISDNHNRNAYKDVLRFAFAKEGIEYSEEEILRHFIFYKYDIFKDTDMKDKIYNLISKDYRILKYSIPEMVMAVCHTKESSIVKKLLSQIFSSCSDGQGDIFDEVIIISYLINTNFNHKDLKKNLAILNVGVANFIKKNCEISFFTNFEKNINYNNLYDHTGEPYTLLIEDEIIWFQFFMYNYSEKTGEKLESHPFLKSFFDRFIAHLMNCSGKETCGGTNKPNIRKYYSQNNISKGLESIGIVSIDGKSIIDVITKAHELRNRNPLNHASSEILEFEDMRFSELSESKKDLLKIVEICLDVFSLKKS